MMRPIFAATDTVATSATQVGFFRPMDLRTTVGSHATEDRQRAPLAAASRRPTEGLSARNDGRREGYM